MCGYYCLSEWNYPLAGLCQDLVSKYFLVFDLQIFVGGLFR